MDGDSMTTHPVPEQLRDEVSARAPRQTLYAAKRALFQQNNRILLSALCVESLALVAVLMWTHGVYKASLERPPLYFGIERETGSIYQLRPEALNVQINDLVLRHAIEGFVAKHFTRLPVITSREYKGTLLMMDSNLTGPSTQVPKELKEITDLDDNANTHEHIAVKVQNTTFEGLESGCKTSGKPCTATVYFTRSYSQGGIALRQSSSILKVNFFRLEKVRMDPDMITYNPLGIVIIGMYESEGR
jgi:hypothetical protein